MNSYFSETKVQRTPSFWSLIGQGILAHGVLSVILSHGVLSHGVFINYFRKVTDISYFPFLTGTREGQASLKAGAEWNTVKKITKEK